MFSILTKSIPRRTLIQSVRCLSQKPPSSNKQAKPPLKPQDETRKPAESPINKPVPKPDESTPINKPVPKPAESTPIKSPEPKLAESTPPINKPMPIKNPEPKPAELTPIRKTVEPKPMSTVPTLDFSPPEPSEEAQKTGAMSSKGYKTASERTRRTRTRVSLAVLFLGLSAYAVYMGREWEEEELKMKKMKIEDAPSTRWGRTIARLMGMVDVFVEPAWPELLPPPYPPPYQKPYTLLLSVDDLLVTSQWDREHGWRTAKRPGVDYFLAYMSQFYEVVIFTTQPGYTVDPILDKLDRYHLYLMYRLYREATRFVDGKIVKDLSYLNRDLSKVIMLDTDPDHVSTHPDNAVVLPKWKGDPKDKGLVAMIPFLESIAIYNPPDVRPILKAYEGKDVPLEYAKTEAKAKAKHIEEWNAKHKPVATTPSFRNLFGLATFFTKNEPPPTYLERKRQEAQKDYRLDRANIERQKDELEKFLEEDQRAMAAQVPGNLWEAMDRFAGNPPPPVPAAPIPGSSETQAPEKKAQAPEKKA